MSGSLVVLVPPSEGKEPGGSQVRKSGAFDGPLRGARREVLREVSTLLTTDDVTQLERVLGVRGPLMVRARQAMNAVVAGRSPLLPAWQRYSGVVWTHLDPTSLRPNERRRLLVPSGLYGVNTGEDLISDYRLKMNISLGSLGRLDAFWRSQLTDVLGDYLHGKTVINLLPNEHAAAIDVAGLATVTKFVVVSFVQSSGGRASGHAAKAVKGVLARQLIREGVDVLQNFRWEGWRTRQSATSWEVLAPK